MSLTIKSSNPCKTFFRELLRAIFRTKTTTHEYSKLSKILDMFDVTMLGLGTTIGMGSYIFIGFYAQEIGPAMIISHFLAASISFMNALCYAEFVSREPGSGGAYSQAYYLLGEFLAAIIGWLLAAENIVGSALSARGLSEVIDKCAGNRISGYLKSYMTFKTPILADYPDVAAVLIELTILSSEVTEPERTIPISLLLSVIIATVLYLFQSFTYTLVWPYCDQDTTAPIQHTMTSIGMDIMKWVTTVGCPIGLLGK
ncbi:unnamed protein product [Nezara viridula]|uniref:Amino acid permease/ SLC12A domain-containing protein n=1 Tax=Nezara viridula TaxID=85310 RepID=A0A9P0HQY0_NEZVI|nr:unnamed protein product [Nezara viridula]